MRNFNHVYTDVDNREKASSRTKKKKQQRNKGDASRCKNNINENSTDNGGEKM